MTTTPDAAPRSPVLRALAVLALLVCLLILGVLGTWQASRFLDRRVMFEKMETRLALDPLEVTSARALTEDVDFRKVRLEGGGLMLDRTAIIQRRFHKHLAGDWTFTPYAFSDGSMVMVHTGWVPENRPDLYTNTPAQPLIGMVITPKRTNPDEFARRDDSFELRDLPRLGEPDAAFLYSRLGEFTPPPRFDTIVVLSGPAEPNTYPTPSFEHITKPYLTPAVHFGYATLWYGSALLLCWLFWAGWTGRLDPHAR